MSPAREEVAEVYRKSSHQPCAENGAVRGHRLMLYSPRIKGHLGETCIATFPEMVLKRCGNDLALTGVLLDQSGLFGVLAQVEALGLE
jgi:hypothetical protein